MRKKTITTKNKTKIFSFWNSFCFSSFICNKYKRNFVRIISQVIDKKLSVDHLLKISNNLEMLKEFTLNEEDLKTFNELPPLTFDEQMRLFNIET